MALSQTSSLVTVFGGSGFVGTYIVKALAKRGYRVRVAVRRPDLAGHLQPLGGVGQIHAVQANVRDEASVQRAIKGADAVINLVGVLASGGKQTFSAVHAKGAEAIAKACKAEGIKTLVHMSALGAAEDSGAEYAQTKAQGEAAVLENVPSAVIIRPSIVFGPEDNFFNQFARMAQLSPALPLIGGGATKFQPVYVGDVAEAFAKAIDGELMAKKPYELGGPEVMSFKEVLQYICKETRRKPLLLPLPWIVSSALGIIGGMIPGKPITEDQVEMLKTDNVISDAAKKAGLTLEGLGITPTAVEAIVPQYLYTYRKGGQFADQSKGLS